MSRVDLLKSIRKEGFIKFLNEIGFEITEAIQKELIRQDKVATGELKDSIYYDVRTISDNNFLLEFEALEYFYYVNYGRKPGSWAPVDAIQDWVIDKGITNNAEDVRSIAYLINRKIFEKGIKPTNILEKVFNEFDYEPTIKSVTDYMEVNITDNMIAQIKFTKQTLDI